MPKLIGAAVDDLPESQESAFVGLWRIKHIRPSLINNLDTLNMSPPSLLDRYKNHLINIGTNSTRGLTCNDPQPTPQQDRILRRLSLADKKDFTHQELLQALKTCEISDFKGVSEKFINSLIEAKVSCTLAPHSPNPNASSQYEQDVKSLSPITILSKKYALWHLQNHYLCLERVLPLAPEPVKLASYKFLEGSANSPIGKATTNQPKPQDPPKYPTAIATLLVCKDASFAPREADNSPLANLLGKSSLVAQETLEAAFKTCNIFLSSEPLKKIRLMRHYEVLCGDLLLPSDDDGHLQWFAITPQNQILAATSHQFLCFSQRKNRNK